MTSKINSALDVSKDMYYRLILLVGTSSDNTLAMREIPKELDTEVINLNLELSKLLLNKTLRQRKLDLTKAMQLIVRGKEITFIDHAEILFDVDLGQDPLRLLEGLSRNQAIVVSWNGKVLNDKLIYGEIGHPEYRSYSTKDLVIIETNIDKEII